MPIELGKKTVKDLEVTTSQHGAQRALALLARLAGIAGPALEKLTGVDLEANAAPVIGAIMKGLDPSEIPVLTGEILRHTTINCDNRVWDMSHDDAFDSVFSGKRLSCVFPVLGFVLKHNFGDFLGDALTEKPDAQAVVSASKSPTSAPTPGLATDST